MTVLDNDQIIKAWSQCATDASEVTNYN